MLRESLVNRPMTVTTVPSVRQTSGTGSTSVALTSSCSPTMLKTESRQPMLGCRHTQVLVFCFLGGEGGFHENMACKSFKWLLFWGWTVGGVYVPCIYSHARCSCCKQLRCLCLCDVFWSLLNSLVCWFCTGAPVLILCQVVTVLNQFYLTLKKQQHLELIECLPVWVISLSVDQGLDVYTLFLWLLLSIIISSHNVP